MEETDRFISELGSLIRSYNPFATERELKILLTAHSEVNSKSKVDYNYPRKSINDLARKHYQNEAILKHELINFFLQQGKNDEVVFFEYGIEDSRADLCRVSGHSIAYEIKTELDDFSRLEKQLNDYSKGFDYTYVVLPKSRFESVNTLIPDLSGVITYTYKKDEFTFAYRKAGVRNSTSITSQVASLTACDLKHLLALSGHNTDRLNRRSLEEVIFSIYGNKPQRFNFLFKKLLKEKFTIQWTFLKDNFVETLPLDTQTTFQKMIKLR